MPLAGVSVFRTERETRLKQLSEGTVLSVSGLFRMSWRVDDLDVKTWRCPWLPEPGNHSPKSAAEILGLQRNMIALVSKGVVIQIRENEDLERGTRYFWRCIWKKSECRAKSGTVTSVYRTLHWEVSSLAKSYPPTTQTQLTEVMSIDFVTQQR